MADLDKLNSLSKWISQSASERTAACVQRQKGRPRLWRTRPVGCFLMVHRRVSLNLLLSSGSCISSFDRLQSKMISVSQIAANLAVPDLSGVKGLLKSSLDKSFDVSQPNLYNAAPESSTKEQAQLERSCVCDDQCGTWTEAFQLLGLKGRHKSVSGDFRRGASASQRQKQLIRVVCLTYIPLCWGT